MQAVHPFVSGNGFEAGLFGLVDNLLKMCDLLPEKFLHLGVSLRFELADQGRSRIHHRLAKLGLTLEFDSINVLLVKNANADLVGKTRDERGVYGVVLREVPFGLRELADPQRIRIGDLDVELVQKGYEIQLVAAGRFDTDDGIGLSGDVAQFPKPFDRVVDLFCRRTDAFLRRRDKYVEFGLGDINSHQLRCAR